MHVHLYAHCVGAVRTKVILIVSRSMRACVSVVKNVKVSLEPTVARCMVIILRASKELNGSVGGNEMLAYSVL